MVSGSDTNERRIRMNTTLFNTYKVKNRDTQAKLAEDMGLPQSALSARINGKIEFRQNEINFIRERWNLTDKETVDIFFTEEVSKEDTMREGA